LITISRIVDTISFISWIYNGNFCLTTSINMTEIIALYATIALGFVQFTLTSNLALETRFRIQVTELTESTSDIVPLNKDKETKWFIVVCFATIMLFLSFVFYVI